MIFVKCKNGSLSDVNNYTAISISTSMSKTFECVVANQIHSASEGDEYPFGFKASHLTAMCTIVLSKLLITIGTMEATYLPFLLTMLKLLTM